MSNFQERLLPDFDFGCNINQLGEGAKKLTNVSLYVCMSAGNSEMLVFLSVFFPTMRIFQVF